MNHSDEEQPVKKPQNSYLQIDRKMAGVYKDLCVMMWKLTECTGLRIKPWFPKCCLRPCSRLQPDQRP